MNPVLFYCICVAGALAGPLVLLLGALLVISMVRSMRFQRVRGWQAEQVPHSKKLELYHSCSIDMDAQKVLCCLLEKNIDFKERELDIGFFGTFEQLEDDMLRVNPNGSQPTLVHDGHSVIGIEEIISYLEDHIPGPQVLARSADPAEQEEVIRWVRLANHAPTPGDDKGPARWTMGMATRVLSFPALTKATRPPTFCTALWAVWRHPNPMQEFAILPYSLTRHFRSRKVAPQKAAKTAFAVIAQTLKELEKCLGADGQEFIVGQNFTLADICVVVNLNRLELLGLLELVLGDQHPKTTEYYARMKRRASFGPSFRPKRSSQGQEELDRCLARFRKEVADQGLIAAFKLDEDGEEEEED